MVLSGTLASRTLLWLERSRGTVREVTGPRCDGIEHHSAPAQPTSQIPMTRLPHHLDRAAGNSFPAGE